LERGFFVASLPEILDDVRAGRWKDCAPPDNVVNITTMLWLADRKLLFYLAKEYFSGAGVIVDAGCFLGGSTLALAEGAKHNPAASTFRKPFIYSYDLYLVESWAVGNGFGHQAASVGFERTLAAYQARSAGESFRDLFEENLKDHLPCIKVFAGDVCESPPPRQPIELLFVDIMKSAKTCEFIIANYFPLLIPGRSVLIHQDYLFTEYNHWIHITMEVLEEYFEILTDCDRGSVAYLYRKAIPKDLSLANLYSALTPAEKIQLMDKAINRWSDAKRSLLVQSKQWMFQIEKIDQGLSPAV